MSDRNKFLSELKSKRGLILHTYGSFLEKQTRLSYMSALNGLRFWEDISQRRKLFMLDDITTFAIAGRRLADLCKLQSSFETLKVSQVNIIGKDGDLSTAYKSDDKVGFYSFLSRIIHMSYFYYYDSKREFRMAMSTDDINVTARYFEFITAPLDTDRIDGFILTRENKYGAIAVKLVDVLNCSIEAAEKIFEVCSSAGIDLEGFERDV